MTRLNTCPDCGHYSWAHSDTGCTVQVYDADAVLHTSLCSCEKRHQDLTEYEWKGVVN